MSRKILEAFKKKKRFNVFELALKLQADKNQVRERLNVLVNRGELRVEGKKFTYG